MAKKASKHLGPWFRMYASTLDNPKLAKLSDAQFRGWVKLGALATECGGIIPDVVADICFRLRMPAGRVRDLLQVLLSAVLLERCDGGFMLHDWEERQFDSDVSTHRVKAFRERQKQQGGNVSVTANVTPPDTETDTEAKTETEPEEKKEEPAPQADAAPPSPLPIVTPSEPDKPPPRRKLSALPDNFPYQDDIEAAVKYWAGKGRGDLSALTEYDKFRAHHEAHGSRMADWPAAWRTWFHKAVEFTKPPPQPFVGRGQIREFTLEEIMATRKTGGSPN